MQWRFGLFVYYPTGINLETFSFYLSMIIEICTSSIANWGSAFVPWKPAIRWRGGIRLRRCEHAVDGIITGGWPREGVEAVKAIRDECSVTRAGCERPCSIFPVQGSLKSFSGVRWRVHTHAHRRRHYIARARQYLARPRFADLPLITENE